MRSLALMKGMNWKCQGCWLINMKLKNIRSISLIRLKLQNLERTNYVITGLPNSLLPHSAYHHWAHHPFPAFVSHGRCRCPGALYRQTY